MGAFGEIALDAYDALISRFSPKRARLRALRLDAMQSAFEAAESGRTSRDYYTASDSLDTELELYGERETIRDRARGARHNVSIASAVVDAYQLHVVGTGIKPQVKVRAEILGITREQARQFARVAESVWERWAKCSDITRRLSFYRQQRLALASLIESGEILSVPAMAPVRGRLDLERRCELIDPIQLTQPGSRMPTKSFRAGIEFDAQGLPIRYHILRTDPTDLLARQRPENFSVIDAYDGDGRPRVIHIFDPLGTGQSRGVSKLHAVLRTINRYGRFTKAEEVAQHMAACIGLIIKTPHQSVTAFSTGGTDSESGHASAGLSPGMIKTLPAGFDAMPFTPDRNISNNAVPYIEHLQREIAMGVGLSYGTITRDYSKSNFSNTKAEIQHDLVVIDIYRAMMAEGFCQPYFELVMEEAWAKGMLPDFVEDFPERLHDWCRVKWIGTPGRRWLDPVKDAQSAQLGVELGVDSPQRIAMERGSDVEEVLTDQAEMMELRRTLGLMATSTPVSDDEDEEEEDEDDGDT